MVLLLPFIYAAKMWCADQSLILQLILKISHTSTKQRTMTITATDPCFYCLWKI